MLSTLVIGGVGWAPRIPLAEGLAAMWRHGLQRKLKQGPRP
jgi:hypothetical protein